MNLAAMDDTVTEDPATPPQRTFDLPSPTAAPPDRSIDQVEMSPALALRKEKRILTASEVLADPILSALAKKQSAKDPSMSIPPSFKAKPAPKTTLGEGGPRLTKTEALRQGLKWEKTPRQSIATATAVPAVRREMNIKALAAPSIAPRPTRASQLRNGKVPPLSPSMARRDAAAAATRASAEEAKAKRRQSMAKLASLGAPSITPRANRSSVLRAGGVPTSSARTATALGTTTADNVPPATKSEYSAGKKLARRVSVAGTVKSLAAPSIQPRLNKTAMLRTRASSEAPPLPPASARSAGQRSTLSTTVAGPKSTKASLLRAGLGAKAKVGTATGV